MAHLCPVLSQELAVRQYILECQRWDLLRKHHQLRWPIGVCLRKLNSKDACNVVVTNGREPLDFRLKLLQLFPT